MKYIVYKTTNLVNYYIYIGVHKTYNPDVFDGYIGNGVYINQPETYKYSKTKFQTAVNEFGVKNFRRETLAIFDTPEEASFLEEQLVNFEFLKRSDVYNMILGGYHSDTVAVYQYDLNGNYIKKFDSYQDAATEINKTVSGIYNSILYNCKCGEFYWAKEKVDVLDISNYNKVIPIKVYRYLGTGEFDKEFDSISSAAKDSSLTTMQISKSAKLGYKAGNYYFSFIKSDGYDKAKSLYLSVRPVYKYDSSGKFLKEYSNQIEAERENKGSNITSAINHKSICKNGFLWALEKLPVFCKTNSAKKKVGMFNLNGQLLKEWDSVKSCIEETKITKRYITYEVVYKGEYIFRHI